MYICMCVCIYIYIIHTHVIIIIIIIIIISCDRLVASQRLGSMKGALPTCVGDDMIVL